MGQTRVSSFWVKLAGQTRGFFLWGCCSNSWVIFGKEYGVRKMIFSCPKQLCITKPPIWSNTVSKLHPPIIKNDKVPRQNISMVDILLNFIVSANVSKVERINLSTKFGLKIIIYPWNYYHNKPIKIFGDFLHMITLLL